MPDLDIDALLAEVRACDAERASTGYQSGMGTIFREVAAITPLRSLDMLDQLKQEAPLYRAAARSAAAAAACCSALFVVLALCTLVSQAHIS